MHDFLPGIKWLSHCYFNDLQRAFARCFFLQIILLGQSSPKSNAILSVLDLVVDSGIIRIKSLNKSPLRSLDIWIFSTCMIRFSPWLPNGENFFFIQRRQIFWLSSYWWRKWSEKKKKKMHLLSGREGKTTNNMM